MVNNHDVMTCCRGCALCLPHISTRTTSGRLQGCALTKHTSRFIQLFVGLCLIVLMAAGCDVGRSEPVVKVGVVAPFDGELSMIGYDVLYSVRLAVREVNEAGGLDGVRVLPVVYSDSGDPVKAREVAEALAIDPAVVAVIGHWQGETTDAAVAVYEEAGLTLVRMGEGGLGTFDPAGLPVEFQENYTEITFEQSRSPSVWAGTAYDGMQLIFRAIGQTMRTNGETNRADVGATLPEIRIDGLSGDVFTPSR